jgi:hypothetical protein
VIEVYAFLAVFTVQVLMSLLSPIWVIRCWRAQATVIPDERLAQLLPGVDFSLARERTFARYRARSTGIAALGVLLLGWLFSYMRHPDWQAGIVVAAVCSYYVLQTFWPGFRVWRSGRSNNVDNRSLLLERKRKAILQRRALFDFVSPLTVFVAVASYLLFAAFVIRHPAPRLAGVITLGAATLSYAILACGVYGALYGKQPNPFETHDDRVRRIGLIVRSRVYSCIASVAFMAAVFTIELRDLERWLPLASSASFVVGALLTLMATVRPRQSGVDRLGSGGRHAPEARDLSA